MSRRRVVKKSVHVDVFVFVIVVCDGQQPEWIGEYRATAPVAERGDVDLSRVERSLLRGTKSRAMR